MRKDILMENNYELTVVVPCMNEEATVEIFYAAVEKVRVEKLGGITVQYLFIDDGSLDRTLDEVKALRRKDPNVQYVSFSRNFGKEAAIYAGLSYARGRLVTAMDADLQDPPELLPVLYKAVTEEGYDCAGTRRVTRKGEPPIRSFFARQFYKLINRFSKTEIVDGARDFQMMNRKTVDAILSMKEVNRFSKGIFGWIGFRKKWIEFENVERVAGETKWSFWKLFLYALDGIIGYSTVPLVFASVMGTVFCLIAFVMILVIIIKTLIFGDPTSGWPSLVCILFFVSGIQLFCTGILGQYLAKTYLETKQRPIFLVEEARVAGTEESDIPEDHVAE